MIPGSELKKFAPLVLEHRTALLSAWGASLISAAAFGLGLSLMSPALQLLTEGESASLSLFPIETLGSFTPQYLLELNRVLSEVLPSDAFARFITIVTAGILLNLMSGGFRFLHEYLTTRTIARAARETREQVHKRLIGVPMAIAFEFRGADQLSRLLNDLQVVYAGFEALLGRASGNILRSLAALILAFLLGWKLALLALLGAPFAALVLRFFNALIHRNSKSRLALQGQLLEITQRTILHLGLVKVCVAEKQEEARFHRANAQLYRQESSLNVLTAATVPVLESLLVIGLGVAVVAAAWLVFFQGVKPANFVTVVAAMVTAAQGLRPLADISNRLAAADAAAERLKATLNLPLERAARPGTPQFEVLKRHAKSIRFDDVSFTYPGNHKAAISEIRLTIPFGQLTAFVGSNGSGKTTLMSLIPCLFEPEHGRILIDAVDIREVTLTSLRRQIAVVPQENFLFNGTIEENLSYGLEEYPRERLDWACHLSGAAPFISTLKDGYNTNLGDLGSGISTGQKQKLAIARALLADPAILIFDEATSHVDPESRLEIRRSLREFQKGRTLLYTTHRAEEAAEADLVVVMDRGRIIDSGKHSELILRSAEYRNLQNIDGVPVLKEANSKL